MWFCNKWSKLGVGGASVSRMLSVPNISEFPFLLNSRSANNNNNNNNNHTNWAQICATEYSFGAIYYMQ